MNDAVTRAELAARAAFEAHDPQAWQLVRVAEIRRAMAVVPARPQPDDGCPLCADGHHQQADERERCTCCGYDLAALPPVEFS